VRLTSNTKASSRRSKQQLIYVYAYIYIYIYIYIYMCIYIYAYLFVYLCIYIKIYVCAFMYYLSNVTSLPGYHRKNTAVMLKLSWTVADLLAGKNIEDPN